jgi:hypothetical protein
MSVAAVTVAAAAGTAAHLFALLCPSSPAGAIANAACAVSSGACLSAAVSASLAANQQSIV